LTLECHLKNINFIFFSFEYSEQTASDARNLIFKQKYKPPDWLLTNTRGFLRLVYPFIEINQNGVHNNNIVHECRKESAQHNGNSLYASVGYDKKGFSGPVHLGTAEHSS
jgi:hypothetical protein